MTGAREDYSARIGRARTWARDHLDESPTLGDLARAAAFSPYHFHRLFTALTGETPAEHVRRLKVEQAANRLVLFPGRPVTEVALDSGFSTPSAFARDFRARFGASPSAYRKRRLADLARGRGSGPGEPPPPAPRPAPGPETRTELPRIEDLGPVRLACVSHFGPYGPGIGAAWGVLMRWAGPRDLAGPDSPVFGISWDNPDVTPERRLRYDACLAVPPDTEGSGPVSVRDLPALRCLVHRYTGPERGFAGAYHRLYYGILPDSGWEPADHPVLERYLTQPRLPWDRRFDVELLLPVQPLK